MITFSVAIPKIGLLSLESSFYIRNDILINFIISFCNCINVKGKKKHCTQTRCNISTGTNDYNLCIKANDCRLNKRKWVGRWKSNFSLDFQHREIDSSNFRLSFFIHSQQNDMAFLAFDRYRVGCIYIYENQHPFSTELEFSFWIEKYNGKA